KVFKKEQYASVANGIVASAPQPQPGRRTVLADASAETWRLRMLGTRVRIVIMAGLATFVASAARMLAQSSLVSAQSVAVLGGSTVTNTGPSVLTGDLGVSPGGAITGFPPGIRSGTT